MRLRGDLAKRTLPERGLRRPCRGVREADGRAARVAVLECRRKVRAGAAGPSGPRQRGASDEEDRRLACRLTQQHTAVKCAFGELDRALGTHGAQDLLGCEASQQRALPRCATDRHVGDRGEPLRGARGPVPIEPRGGAQLGFEAHRHLEVGRPQPLDHLVEQREPASRFAHHDQHSPEPEHRLPRDHRVLGRGAGAVELSDRIRIAQAGLRLAERHQDRCPRRRRGFRERALEQRHRLARSAADESSHAGGVELVGNPRIAARLAVQQVRRESLQGRMLGVELARCGGVQKRAAPGGDGIVDRLADEWVNVGQHARAGQDAGAAEGVRCFGGVVEVQAGQGGGRPERRLVAEDRRRIGDRRRRRAEAVETRTRPALEACRRDLLDAPGVCRRRRETGVPQGTGKLADEQRVAARGMGACCDEAVVRLGAEALAQQLSHGMLAERAYADLLALAEQGRQLDAGAIRAVARRRDDGGSHAIEPARQVREPGKRRGVRPVSVIDDEKHGPVIGQTYDKPEESEKARLVRIRRGQRGPIGRQAEDRRGEAGRAGKGGSSRGLIQAQEMALKQLARDAERERALQRARACGEHARPSSFRVVPNGAEKLGLADPGWTAEGEHASSACGDVPQQARDRRQLSFPVQEHRSSPQAKLAEQGRRGKQAAVALACLRADVGRLRSRPAAMTLSPQQSPSQTPLLEREAELEAIADLLRDVHDGRGRALVLDGDAGTGKTSLVDAAAREAKRDGFRVLSARGEELEREFAFGLVRQLFGPLRRRLSPAEVDELLSGAAALAGPLLGWRAGELAMTIDASEPAFHGLYWLTVDLAELNPLLLLVDDAHQADRASARWLFYLARRIESVRVGIIVARRPGQMPDDALSRLKDEPLTATRWLAPLSPAGVAELVRKRGWNDPELTQRCYAVTSGNPLYLSELLREVGEHGRRSVPTDAAGVHSFARIIGHRLAGLPEEAASLAEAAAILGRNAPLTIAAELAGIDDPEAARAADVLLAAGLMGDGGTSFAHPVIRDVLYDRTGAATRRLLHRRAAEILLARHAPSEVVAAHVLASGPGEVAAAAPVLRAAAREALGRGAPETAVSSLRRAVDEPMSSDERHSCLLELGLAEELADDPAAAVHLAEALELASDPESSVEVRIALARVLLGQGEAMRAVELLDEAVSASQRIPRELELRVSTELLACVKTLGQLDEWPPARIRGLERRLHALVDSGDQHRTAADAGALCVLCTRGDEALSVPEALAQARTALAEDRLLRELPIGSPVVSVALETFVWAGAPGEAVRHLDAALELAQRQGSPAAVALTLAQRAEARLGQGRVVEAESDAASALELSPGRRFIVAELFATAWLTLALVERDRADAANELLRTRRLDGELGTETMFVPLHFARGSLRAAQGEYERAAQDFAAAGTSLAGADLSRPGVVAWRAGEALARHALGDSDAAHTLVDEEIRSALRFRADVALAIALRASAVLHSDPAEALDRLIQSVELLERSDTRLELARSLAALGVAMRRGGARRDAREPLRRALDLTHRCGALALHRQVEAELRSVGARPRRKLLSGHEALTPGERRVADLASHGLSNREIAQRLFLTVKTVETHLSHVYLKLEVPGRHELAAKLEPTPD